MRDRLIGSILAVATAAFVLSSVMSAQTRPPDLAGIWVRAYQRMPGWQIIEHFACENKELYGDQLLKGTP